MRPRDNQRSKCYEWEGKAKSAARSIVVPSWRTVPECEAWLAPIWRAERGRYGRAKVPVPTMAHAHWGQTRALAHHDHRITLPMWARNGWVVLHEAAHRLTPADEAHGPRFVGVLIGLVCRHMDYDAGELMSLADSMGLKYHVRSIGTVPVHGPAWWIERTVREQGAMTEMEIASWLHLSYLQVRGGALALIRAGRARWLRKKLVLIGEAAPRPPAPPPAPKVPKPPRPGTLAHAKIVAEQHGIEIEKTDTVWWVYPPSDLEEDDVEHYHDTVKEVVEAVNYYADLLTKKSAAAKDLQPIQ